MKSLYLLLICLLTGIITNAQDKIFRKNGQVVKAKIIEVGTSEIKYKLTDTGESPIYVLEKERISKVQYENGKIEKFTVNLKDPEQYIGQLRKAIKIDFLGPLLGYTQITYEKSTSVGKSYELSLGIIGAGKSQTLDYGYNSVSGYEVKVEKKKQFGAFLAGGYKFSKLPDFLFGRTRFMHVMQGAYAKPVVYLGNYSENVVAYKGNNEYFTERKNITFGALQLELGKQWVFGDKFLVDAYWGLGYGFDNKKGNPDYYYDDATAYNYANARVGNSPGFSSTFALKLGLLIK
jgi:hypothetical protein